MSFADVRRACRHGIQQKVGYQQRPHDAITPGISGSRNGVQRSNCNATIHESLTRSARATCSTSVLNAGLLLRWHGAAAIGTRNEAFGAHWCLPGGGPLSARQFADLAGHHLGSPIKLRSAGMMTLRIVSLFNKELRGFLQVAPDYLKPVRYDARKLQGLLGPPQMTSYDAGISHTLTWIASAR